MGVVVAGLTWVALQGRVRAQVAESELVGRRHDRWTQEVEPSLRAAGLADLSTYESAVAETERLRAEAERLRGDANSDDQAAAEAESSAAPLESRRAELIRIEADAQPADPVAVAARLEEHAGGLTSVQRRILDLLGAIDGARQRLRANADAGVNQAGDERLRRQGEYDAAGRDVAVAETTLNLARQQLDSDEAVLVRARLAELAEGMETRLDISSASAALEEARRRQTTALTKAETLQVRLDAIRPVVARRVEALGNDLVSARQQTHLLLEGVAAELATLDTPDAGHEPGESAGETATREHARLTEQLVLDKAALDAATAVGSDAERELLGLENECATRRGHLAAIDRPAIESRLQTATSDLLVQPPESPALDPAAAQATFEHLREQLGECNDKLNHARGQLHLIAGHVGSERLAEQEAAVQLAHTEVLERERMERAALRLLREIEVAEAARATHLGRALAGPITETFRSLTGGRYGPLVMAPALSAEAIEVQGAARPLDRLSVGTREQLATLLRVAIAGYLRTVVILDDQLVHSDHERLAWFRERLAASAQDRGHQIVVFTCRPDDYVDREAEWAATVIDLATVMSRREEAHSL